MPFNMHIYNKTPSHFRTCCHFKLIHSTQHNHQNKNRKKIHLFFVQSIFRLLPLQPSGYLHCNQSIMGFKSLFKKKKHQPDLPIESAAARTFINSRSPSVRLNDELEHVFKKFDANGDGKICAEELGSIMGSLGHPVTEEELRIMIKEVDADGDGFINLNEFIELNTSNVVRFTQKMENGMVSLI